MGRKSRKARHKNSCWRKIRHNSEAHAKMAAWGKPELVSYLCFCCKGWHNGKPTEKDKGG